MRLLIFTFLAFLWFPTPLALMADELLSDAQIEAILGEDETDVEGVSTPREVLFCWSEVDHPKGTHSYERFAHLSAEMLNEVEGVRAITTEGFPTPQQWKTSDLVVLYLTHKAMSEADLRSVDAHLSQGRSLIVIHQALVQRETWAEWAERIGFAYSWAKTEEGSRWGQGILDVSIDSDHPIFEGYPESVTIDDELYWNLQRGSRGDIQILAETRAPVSKAPDDPTLWPVFWTVEHPGQTSDSTGRVFCAVIGHWDHFQDSPFFRFALLRGIAWSLEEPFAPFRTAFPK